MYYNNDEGGLELTDTIDNMTGLIGTVVTAGVVMKIADSVFDKQGSIGQSLQGKKTRVKSKKKGIRKSTAWVNPFSQYVERW